MDNEIYPWEVEAQFGWVPITNEQYETRKQENEKQSTPTYKMRKRTPAPISEQKQEGETPHGLELSAVMYLRKNRKYQGNGDEQYTGTVDTVIDLMAGFASQHTAKQLDQYKARIGELELRTKELHAALFEISLIEDTMPEETATKITKILADVLL